MSEGNSPPARSRHVSSLEEEANLLMDAALKDAEARAEAFVKQAEDELHRPLEGSISDEVFWSQTLAVEFAKMAGSADDNQRLLQDYEDQEASKNNRLALIIPQEKIGMMISSPPLTSTPQDSQQYHTVSVDPNTLPKTRKPISPDAFSPRQKAKPPLSVSSSQPVAIDEKFVAKAIMKATADVPGVSQDARKKVKPAAIVTHVPTAVTYVPIMPDWNDTPPPTQPTGQPSQSGNQIPSGNIVSSGTGSQGGSTGGPGDTGGGGRGGGGGGGSGPPGGSGPSGGAAGQSTPQADQLTDNPNNNAIQRRLAFSQYRVTSQLIGINLGLGPIVAPFNAPNLYPYLFLASRGEAYLSGTSHNALTMVVAAANLVAQYVPSEVLNQADARARFRLEVITMIGREMGRGVYFEITDTDYRTTISAGGALVTYAAKLPATWGGWDTNYTPTLCADVNLTADILSDVLVWVILFATHKLKRIAPSVFAHTYIAFAKRGTVSDSKANSIAAALSAELGYPVEVSAESIRLVYQQLSSRMNSELARKIFDKWGAEMKDLSLRMRITLSQASGSGLTALSACKNALLMYPNFRWDEVVRLLPRESRHLLEAFFAVKGDPYYGFNPDMGLAASTRYRSIAYVSKELLRLWGGSEFSSLANYQGWTRTPAEKESLVELLRTYVPSAHNIPDPNAPAVVDNLMVFA